MDGNAPLAGTELPGYPPFRKEKNITVSVLRHTNIIVSVLRHTVWNAAVLGICGGSFCVTVEWVACLVCVADSYHSLNIVLCAQHFCVMYSAPKEKSKTFEIFQIT